MKLFKIAILALTANAIKVKTGIHASLYDGSISLAEALSSSGTDLDQDQFDKVFIRQDGMNHILYSEHQQLLSSLAKDFSQYIKVSSLGQTWEKRDISLIEIDAREMARKNLKSMGKVEEKHGKKKENAENSEENLQKVVDETMADEDAAKAEADKKKKPAAKKGKKPSDAKNVEDDENTETTENTDEKKEEAAVKDDELVQTDIDVEGEDAPGILITGAHHARELITVQQVYYLISKLIQGGILGNDPEITQQLAQNKFYFIPVVNVDGLAQIQDFHENSGASDRRTHIVDKRKNNNPEMGQGEGCSAQEMGVDLNRNYGVDWSLTSELFKSASDPCFEFYPGKTPFSEPESRAVRDFMASHGDVKFVINFHSNGNSFIWPFNGRNPNDIEKRAPGVLPIFKDIVANANFPPDLVSGNAYDTIQTKVGGDTDDYITATYGIPSVTSEIGYTSQFIDDWVVKSKEQALDVVKLNGYWVDYVFNNLAKFAQQLPKRK